MERILLTQEGAQRLREELHRLKRTERPAAITAIAEARAHGDLKENAEYHAARERQSFIEGRIGHLDDVLNSAQIIDIATIPHTGKVIFGSTVQVKNNDTNAMKTYMIVGEEETDVDSGRISFRSPIAQALIGSQAGDHVDVEAPSGLIGYTVIEVSYGK